MVFLRLVGLLGTFSFLLLQYRPTSIHVFLLRLLFSYPLFSFYFVAMLDFAQGSSSGSGLYSVRRNWSLVRFPLLPNINIYVRECSEYFDAILFSVSLSAGTALDVKFWSGMCDNAAGTWSKR